MCRAASPEARPLGRATASAGRFAVALASSHRSSLPRCFDDAARRIPPTTEMGSTPDTSALSRGGAATHSCPHASLQLHREGR